MLLKIAGSKKPVIEPKNAKSKDTPARVKATGYPSRRAIQTKTKSNRGIISIYYVLKIFIRARSKEIGNRSIKVF